MKDIRHLYRRKAHVQLEPADHDKRHGLGEIFCDQIHGQSFFRGDFAAGLSVDESIENFFDEFPGSYLS